MERVISNSQNLALYPLAGAAIGILISKTIVPLNAMQSAIWVGGLTSTTAVAQQGFQSLLNTNDTPLVKVALAIGMSAALYFASLSSYGASLLGRLSDEIIAECFQSLLISSLISSILLAFQPSLPKKPTESKMTPKPDTKKPTSSPTPQFPEKATVQNTTVQALYGDIMMLPVEAIVNAANEVLLGGSGIDGAIHSKAGIELVQECKKIPLLKGNSSDRIKTGDAVITSSYNIQKDQPTIKYVVHTAGPRAGTSNRQEILANAYRNSLEVARQKGVRSIAFPAISVGIFGYPFEEAQEIAFKTVRKFIEKHPKAFDKVLFSYLTTENDKIAAVERAWKKTF